jgi:hypothetical protein
MLIVLAFLVVVIGVPGYFLFYRTPTCSDGKQNGDETGIDCGGSCSRLCAPDALPLLSRGDSRIITVASNTYEVLALFKNPNPSASIYRANYTIRIYDQNRRTPIRIIEGSTYIPKDSPVAIFEGPFTESSSTPVAAVLEWSTSTMVWEKDAKPSPDISVLDTALAETEAPRLEASARNNSLRSASNVEFVAVIYDESGNVMASSKTYLDTLPAGATQSIIFSWPRPFPAKAGSISVIPRAYPDSSFIK